MGANSTAVRRRLALVLALGLALSFARRAWAQHAEPSEDPEQGTTEFADMLAGGVVATASAPAREFASPPAREQVSQRNFALLALAMPYDGFGLGVRALGPRFGVDLSFAFRPVLATFSTDPAKFPKIAVIPGYQFNAGLYFGLYRPNLRTDLGIAVGYKYNTLLCHGVGAAFYLQRDFAKHFTFLAFVGPAVFPRAEREIRKHTGWTDGSVSSGLAWHQGGLGVSLAFFP